VPIAGSGVLAEVQIADKWRPEPPANRRERMSFEGWIVELDVS